MTPQEEAADLLIHPLPPEVQGVIITAEDKILPTRIAALDMDIEDIELKIKALVEERKDLVSSRTILVDHAVKHKVFEDLRFVLQPEVKYGQRVLDLDAIKKKSPENYKNYIKTLKQKLKDEYTASVAAVNKTVLLGIADNVFGSDTVTACSTRPETVTYKVIPK